MSQQSVKPQQDTDLLSINGLKQVAKTYYVALKDFFHDNSTQWAAAVAYYSLLSTVPLLLVLATVATFFVDQPVAQIMTVVQRYLPQVSGTSEIERLVRDAISQRGSIGLISFLTFLWSGSRVFGAVTKALNIAYDVEDPYSFFKRTFVELVMLLTIGLLLVLALASRAILDLLWGAFSFLPQQPLISQLTSQGLSALLLLLAFFLVYRYVPRHRITWKAAFAGAVTATLLFIVARPLFLSYLSRFGNYNALYGSLAVVITLVLWAWLVAMIMLYGGEVGSHVERILIQGQPAEIVEKRHLERSPTKQAENV